MVIGFIYQLSRTYSPRCLRTLIMFSSPNGLMVVSIVKMYQELISERLTSLFLVVFSEIGIL